MSDKTKKLYKVYNPAVAAYQSLTAEDAKKFVEAAKQVEAQLKADGELK